MSEALYRKYRPQEFKAVIGQDHVVEVLSAEVKNETVSHAYLFTGSRGTGKTSVARILARALGTTDKDLYEIDAASNRGIDDVRELRESVHTLPFDSRYKIYIVDEVHMLTKEAFNALLKTLEEPPAHVLFILATTELQKVPDTIVSRCEVHQFRRPGMETLRKYITTVAKEEGYTIEHEAADTIALLADGSFRDAQGTLQKVLTVAEGKKVDADIVARVTGAPRIELVLGCLSAIAKSDIETVLSTISKALSEAVAMDVFVKLLAERVRLVLLLRHAPRLHATLATEVGEEEFNTLETYAKEENSKISPELLAGLLEAYTMSHYTHAPSAPLELALMKVLSDRN